MARIKNVDLPNKRIEIALTYIHGIGRKLSRNILTKLNINLDTKANDLTDEEISKIRKELDLPVRGQSTRSNARTRKGRGKTVANKKK